ncbi:hypothetical protein [Maribacter arcticus]|uniref:hypothetical protein n=1 Tax=Maribacter arcticus TaxID=561365 RepID=UPI0030023BBF
MSIIGVLSPFDIRITLKEVRQKIVEQSPIFEPDDLIPVTCNLDALVMAYALKIGGILFAKLKKKAGKVFMILAGIYLLLSLSVC